MTDEIASTPGEALLGIPLDRDVKVSLEWATFAANLADSAVQFWLKGPASGVSAGIAAIAKLVASARLERSPGELAWSLAALSFAWALDEVKGEGDIKVEELRKVLREAIHQAKEETEANGLLVPVTFLKRPTTLPLYRRLRESVVREANTFVLNQAGEPAATRFRIDAAFSRAVFEVWARTPELYQGLTVALSVPGQEAAEETISWQSYRRRLIHDFEVSPVFGQEDRKIALGQLYIPLRGYHRRHGTDEAPHSSDLAKHYDPVVLDDSLSDWVINSPEADWLRLIGGGPGSGKSTTLKKLARVVADRPDWRPLYIPLQHIDLDTDLRDAVNRYFTQLSGSPFLQPPLHRGAVEEGPPLLLIFDGLDELAAPNEAVKEVVATFASRLNTLVVSLKGNSSNPLKVVVSGRMPAFQAAKRFLTPPAFGALETYGFVPAWTAEKDPDPLWQIDQRPQWWQQYSNLVGETNEVPEAFRSPKLAGITHEPLLCYLLALAGYATSHWEEAAENPNRIYDALMNSVYERGWGEGAIKRQGPGRSLSRADFNLLMETIALAAWLGGDARVASQEGFEAAVKITHAEAAWAEFQADNGPDVSNLAMNFYLKSSEKEQRGFEFTHKSFGEYLTARSILFVGLDIYDLVDRGLEHAARDWVRATRTGVLTTEILQFLRDEVRLRGSLSSPADFLTKIVELKRGFQKIVNLAVQDGLPTINSPRWRTAEAEQLNSEVAAWGLLNSCVKALAAAGMEEEAKLEIAFDGIMSFGTTLERLTLFGQGVIVKCLSHLVLKGSFLFGGSLYQADLEGCHMESCMFFHCQMSNATFKNANIENINLVDCNLDGVNFQGANLGLFAIRGSILKNCSFKDAKIISILVSDKTLLLSDLDLLESLGNLVLVSGDDEKLISASRLKRVSQLAETIRLKAPE